LISSDGKILKKEKMSESKHEMDLESLPTGLYFLRVLSTECGTIKQVVKM